MSTCIHKYEYHTLWRFRCNGAPFCSWRKCALCGHVVDFVDYRKVIK